MWYMIYVKKCASITAYKDAVWSGPLDICQVSGT